MALQIKDLPPELIVKVLTFLPGKYLGNCCQTCVAFREAVNVDSIWEARCLIEYHFTAVHLQGWNCSFREVYSKVLYKYGSIIGLWQRGFQPYGGLAHITFDYGRILCREYFAPANVHIDQPLNDKELFSIDINKTGFMELSCHKGYKGPHACNIDWDETKERLKFECLQVGHHRHPKGKEQEMVELIRETQEDYSELFLMKFEENYINSGKYKLERMELPAPMRGVPIQPGLFKGQYGAHGIEILDLCYDEEMKNIHVIKITGDGNVPAQNISVYADLCRPMVLNVEQQSSMHTLREIDTPDIPEEGKSESRTQPFVVPRNCTNRVSKVPQRCIYRFHGQGRIAGHGYHDPSLTPGHFMVFDNNTFGFIWMDLYSLSLFSRVEETFE